jgi:hypothetical protein
MKYHVDCEDSGNEHSPDWQTVYSTDSEIDAITFAKKYEDKCYGELVIMVWNEDNLEWKEIKK